MILKMRGCGQGRFPKTEYLTDFGHEKSAHTGRCRVVVGSHGDSCFQKTSQIKKGPHLQRHRGIKKMCVCKWQAIQLSQCVGCQRGSIRRVVQRERRGREMLVQIRRPELRYGNQEPKQAPQHGVLISKTSGKLLIGLMWAELVPLKFCFCFCQLKIYLGGRAKMAA